MNAEMPQMNAEQQRQEMNRISGTVIGAAHAVSNGLGFGFLEKVYENALSHEIRKRGLQVEQQRPVHVYYDRQIVGAYVPDLFVEDRVVVEIKALLGIDRALRQQCLNYLRATGRSLCLLLNFGRPQLQVARVVWNF
jgi:GxxExxY protein